MERPLGRITEPMTESGGPDTLAAQPQADTDPQHQVRDLPPSGRWEDTGITDLDELQRAMDPLDPRKPSRETTDPLDPDGHVI